MRVLVIIILISCLIVSCSSSRGMKGGVNIQDVRENAVAKNYKKILIVGYGPSPTRFFLEKLYSELNRELREKSIESEYLFKGQELGMAKTFFSTALTTGRFDAVMEIAPASIAVVKDKGGDIAGIPIKKEQLRQDFNLKLYDKASRDIVVWESALRVKVNSLRENSYSTIVEK